MLCLHQPTCVPQAKLLRLVFILIGLFSGVTSATAQSDSWQRPYDTAGAFYEAGDFASALGEATRARELAEKEPSGDPDSLAQALNLEAVLLDLVGRQQEAETLYRRALQLREQSLDAADPRIGESLNNLAALSSRLGRYSEAETLHKRALALREQALGPNHWDVAQSLNNLASVELALGRPEKAGPLLRRAVAILSGDRGHTASMGTGRGDLFDFGQSDPDADEGLAHVGKTAAGMRSPFAPSPRLPGAPSPVAMAPAPEFTGTSTPPSDSSAAMPGSQTPGPPSSALQTPAREADLAVTLLNLGMMAQTAFTGPRRDEAGQLYRRALEIQEAALGPDHPDLAVGLNNLAELCIIQQQYEEAERLHKRALAIREKSLGPYHPQVALSLTNLARLYSLTQRPRDAIPILERAVAVSETTLGPNHPDLALSLRSLALAHAAVGDTGLALAMHRKATRSVVAHLLAVDVGEFQNGPDAGESQGRLNYHLQSHIAALYQAAVNGVEPDEAARDQAFELVQRLEHREAARALNQMAARLSQGPGQLADAIRARQDLIAKWHALDAKLLTALGAIANERDEALISTTRAELAATEEKLKQLTETMKRDSTAYAELESPAPLSENALRAILRPDEVLVQFHFGSYGSYVWVIGPSQARWARLKLGRGRVSHLVGTLRCGLDRDGEWKWTPEQVRWFARKAVCATLRPDGLTGSEPLPFDAAAARELYKGLFGEVEELIEDKQLLIVPSSALTSLPFQVLVTGLGEGDDKRPTPGTHWLVRDHALTVLPSAASLAALRRAAKASAAPEPFVGFGNPVLTLSCGSVFVPDKCPDEEIKVAADNRTTRALGPLDAVEDYFSDGLADVDAMKASLCPLPDTAYELACVAKSVGTDAGSLRLGKDMTETAVKSMPLDRYRVVHFATHGLLAGETAQLARNHAEPALVFSPPAAATQLDDGLLTASEVAGLKLDADWVVMSACNTASGAEPGAEALSGLARAFFYAGARALLVSHWPVDSYAATMLTSRTFSEMKNDPTVGRAEAFRRAMLALVSDKARPWTAHPSIWAPFVVVGEGGAAAAR